MMKRLALLASFSALAIPALAHGNDRGEAKATVAGKAVAIDYGRPSLKGRDMLGQAAIGAPWRMGADAATTLKTDADLSFGAVAVPKGEYVLTATKVAEGQWQLNVLTKDKGKVADVPLEVAKVPASVETLTIDLAGDKDKGTFTMSWGDIALKAAFTGK
jgi:DUF2911 family protein